MKKSLRVALILVTLNVAAGCVNAVVAQTPPIAGGYHQAANDDRQVVAAARFALQKERRIKGVHLSLVSIERAETQVVAGTNYRLCLRVKSKNKTEDVTAVVYQNLKRKYSLSSWEAEGCQNPKSM